MRGISWHPDAWKEYLDIQTDKSTLKKVNRLLQDLQRNDYSCSLGKVELLKGDFSGFASVRIDQKNRIIFTVSDDFVIVVQCGGHYLDK